MFAADPIIPSDPEGLQILHDREYRVRAYRLADDRILIEGAVRDQKPPGLYLRADPEPMTIHHMHVGIEISFPGLEILDVRVEFEMHPRDECPTIVEHYQNLVGLSIGRGFTHRVRELFGGPRGCTHTTALLQAMAPVAMQCFYSMRAAKARLDGEPEPMLDRRRHGSDEMWRLNIGTCHVWAPDGDAVAARLTGIPEPAPVFLRGRLERLGLRMTDGSQTRRALTDLTAASTILASVGRRVAVAGVALSDVGRIDDATPYALMAQAARRAIADAGLTVRDIDGFASTGLGTMAPIDVAEYMGLVPRWVDSTAVGGASWEVMAAHATDAISAGHADVVLLAYGSTARADLKKGLRTANLDWGARGPMQWEAPYGHTLISKYAMAARRHMHEHGTTIEQLAEIAVSARFNAATNPEAFVRDPITIDDVLDGPMIADPFTKLQCCIRSDGAAAVVLVSEDRAADLPARPVWILGTGESTSHISMSQWPDFTTGPAAVAGRLAFARAGLTPADVDVCELYDAFTYMLLVTLEDLGFCSKGEGGPFVADGKLRLGGTLPTNTDGGGLSACHPGQRGLFLIVEATKQLRAQAGERQVADAEVACVSGTGGWFCSNGTMLLGV